MTSHKSLDFSGLRSPYSSNEEGDLIASVPSGPVGRDLNPGWGPTMCASSECSCACFTSIATRELGSAHPTAWGLARRKPFGVPQSRLVWAPTAPVTHGSPAPDLPWPSPIYLVSQTPSPCLARWPRARQVMLGAESSSGAEKASLKPQTLAELPSTQWMFPDPYSVLGTQTDRTGPVLGISRPGPEPGMEQQSRGRAVRTGARGPRPDPTWARRASRGRLPWKRSLWKHRTLSSLPLGGDRPVMIQTIHLRAPKIAAVCTGMPCLAAKSLPPRVRLQKYLLPHNGENGRGENQASEKEK